MLITCFNGEEKHRDEKYTLERVDMIQDSFLVGDFLGVDVRCKIITYDLEKFSFLYYSSLKLKEPSVFSCYFDFKIDMLTRNPTYRFTNHALFIQTTYIGI